MITPTKACAACKIEKPANEFYTRNNGKNLRTKCIKCLNQHEYRRREESNKITYIERRKRAYKTANAKKSFERANNINRHKYVYSEAHKQDKKHNRTCDLDIEFVRIVISNGCQYCGTPSNKCKMSLDRIDNTIGHIKTNLVPACVNCNLTRGSMPYEAWTKYFVPAMKEAIQSGLLNNWKANKFS